MTVDALEFLRTEDPVPHGSTAPSMEWVLERIEREGARPGSQRHRRRRRIRLPLVPAFAVAATLAVVAAVVVLAVTHRAQPPSHLPPATRTAPTPRTVPSPQSLLPRGGMRGTVSMNGAASAPPGLAVISFTQCQPCHFGQPVGDSPDRLWLASTVSGGRSWRVARSTLLLTMFAFDGSDGWAEGTGSDRVIHFYASHDGGRSWRLASSSDPAPGYGNVSVAGGEVWSLGNGCVGTRCTDAVLRAPAASDRLAETVTEPPLGHSTNVSVVATGRDAAYVMTDDYGFVGKTEAITRTRLFATHDGGRTWQRLTPACPAHTFGSLYAGGTDALWALCSPLHGGGKVRRSMDGGRHWTTLSSRPGNGAQLYPASAQVAWATNPAGEVFRSADGGRVWARVWYGGQPAPAAPSNLPPGLNRLWHMFLTVQSPTTATVIVEVSRRRAAGHPAQTDFVTYRTTDGGRTWHPGVVRLPAG